MSDTNGVTMNVGDFALKYGESAIGRFGDLPYKSQLAIVVAGVNHICGNVAASAVTQQIREIVNPDSPKDVTTDMVKAWRAANTETAEAMKVAEVADTIKALLDGTVGTRTGGPRGSRIDTEIRAEAKAELTAYLEQKGLKFPQTFRDSAKNEKIEIPGKGLMDAHELISFYLTLPGAKSGETKRDTILRKVEKDREEKAKNSAKSLDSIFG